MATEVLCKLSHGSWSTVLLKELNILRESGIMCDVKILLSGGVQTLAHGCVLSAASPFFKALLQQIEHPEIDMSSFPSDVILQVMNFIYTGEGLFSYSDLNIAHRVTTMFSMTILDTLLRNMMQIDKTGTEETNVVTVSDVPDRNQAASSLGPMSADPTHQLIDPDQYKDDINNISTQLLQGEDDNVLIHQSIDAMVPAVKNLNESQLKTDENRYGNPPSKYNELDTVQLQNVLNDIGDITHLVTKCHHDEKNNQKIKKHRPRDKPIRVLNRPVPNDGTVSDHAVQTLPEQLSLDISKLCSEEKGVFARVSFPRGSTFGPYEGSIITDASIIREIQPRYCWTIYKNCKLLHWLDGHDESKANWMRYVQATIDDDANIKAFQHDGKLYFEVYRRIAATEELLVSSTYIGYRGNLFKDNDEGGTNTNEQLGDNGTTVDDAEVNRDAVAVKQQDDVKVKHDDDDEEEADFPCDECDVIFLVKDMYYRHMHKVHGKPLPLHIYLGTSEACKISRAGKVESTVKEPLDDCIDMKTENLSDDTDVSKTTSGIEEFGHDTTTPKNRCTTSVVESDTLHLRKSCRNRKKSTRLQDFHVPDVSVCSDAKISNSPITDEDSVENQDLVTSDVNQCTPSAKKVYKCDVCHKSFKLQVSLKRHSRLHSSDKQDKIMCKHCGKAFTHVGNLKTHMRIHTGEKPFKCEICGRGFSQNGNKELHMSRHRKENQHICDICGKSYNDISYLNKHTRIQHGGTATIKCPKCRKNLYDMASLRRHMITHTDKKLYKCSTCGKGFNQYANLQSHKRVHTSEKPFKCTDCATCFRTKHELNLHVMSHKGIQRYQCTVCLKSFKYLASLKKHERSGCRVQFKNADEPEADDNSGVFKCRMCDDVFNNVEDFEKHMICHFYECSICRKVFSTECNLNEHQMKHGDYKPFTCDRCGKSYPDERSLKTHVRVHNNKHHKCLVCQKSWPTASILRIHMLMHTGEKPHVCTACNMHFRMKHQLKRHMLTHNKDNGLPNVLDQPRPICPTCGKSFNNRQALKKHEFLHTGLKPYTCWICNKAFATRGTMKMHVTGHFGEKRFKCTLCEKSYRANKDYQIHMATHQPEHQQAYQCSYCEKAFPYKKSLRFHMRSHKMENI